MARVGSRARFTAAVLLLASATRLSAQVPETTVPAPDDAVGDWTAASPGGPATPPAPAAGPSSRAPPAPPGWTAPPVVRITAPGQTAAPSQGTSQAGAPAPRLGPGFQAEAGSGTARGTGKVPGY